MADLKAKIGSDSSEFRNDVASLPNVVKSSFEKMKSASEGGIADNVKSIKRNVTGLKDLLVGGGIVTAIIAFYRAGIEEAERGSAAGNKFAESFLEIRDAASAAFSFIGKASVAIFGSLTTPNKMMREGLENIGAILTGNLGSLQASRTAMEETAKAARSAEASLAESKKHASEFVALTAEAKAQTEKRAELELKALTASEQRSVLELKLLESQRAQAEAGDSALARRTAQVEQMKIENKLLEVGKALADEALKTDEKRRSEADARHKIELDGLDTIQKQGVLMQEISDAQGLINSGLLSARDTEYQRTVLADRQAELLKTQSKIQEDMRKEDEAREQLAQKQNEFASESLLAQQRYVLAKKEEADLRAKIAEMPDGLEKTKEETRLLDAQKKTRESLKDLASSDKELATLLLKGKENLNEVEKVRFDILTGVTTQAKLDKELHELTTKALTSELIPAERARLEILTGQTNELKKQSNEANSYIDQWKNFQVSVQRTGTGYSGQSTTALMGVRDRLNASLSEVGAGGRTYRDADQMTDYGGYLTGITYKTELAAVEKELAQRREISQYASRFGEDATVRKYGDTLAEKALADVRDTSTRTANAVETLSNQLSSVFPKR